MAKKNQNTKARTTKKCQCSICGQVSNAVEGTRHFYCKGIPADMLARLPDKFKGMTNPTRAAKSMWVEWVAPKLEEVAA